MAYSTANEFLFSYREVEINSKLPEKWQEIIFNSGGTQSTLQDIKVPEKAGGYCYIDASKYYTRNRFIYWRINNDTLELVENSLDVNLSGNKVRLRFTDTPILDGITINEFYGSVIILVPTVCSIHCLKFNHPEKISIENEYMGSHSDLSIPSIFADISASAVNDPSTYFVINNLNTTTLPHIAASFLNTAQEESIFVYAYPNSTLFLYRLTFAGKCFTQELKQETIVPKFLSGLTTALRGGSNDGNVAVNIVLHSLQLEIYAITLFADGMLRIWSCSKGQYIANSNVLTDLTNNSHQFIQGAQCHMLKKSVNSNDTDFTLAIFMSFASECQFHIIRPKLQNGNLKLIRCCTLYATDQDLIDFSLDNKRLWAVWRGLDGENFINNVIYDSMYENRWVSVISSPSMDPEYVNCEPGIDPRQSYLNFIFHPGRFSLNVIMKALSIFMKSSSTSDINLSPLILKQQVSLAVEQEIHSEVQEYEVKDEDYLEIANGCWSKFYSCCVQYHAASIKPLGLLLLPSVSGVVLLKKSTYSILRPLDALEHMMFCSESTNIEQFQYTNYPQLSQDSELCSDLIKLMNILVSLEEQLTEEFKYAIEKELHQLHSPDKTMSELVIDLIAGSDVPILSSQYLWTLNQNISNINDLYPTIHLLLEIIRFEEIIDNNATHEGYSKLQHSVNYIFSSDLGTAFVTDCFRQQATVRFSICRNLLLLQTILLERRELDWGVLETIRSVCMPDTVVFMQAYYTVMWLSEATALNNNFTDTDLQRLAPLKLSPVFNLKTRNKLLTLLQLFLSSTGGTAVRKEIQKNVVNDEWLSHWHFILLQFLQQLGQFVWSVNGEFILGEWLLTSGQHIILQQYVRLLNPWCEWNNNSRNFVLAVALLTNGEKYKAKDLFLKSFKGIFSEKFFAQHIVNLEEGNEAKIVVNYYLKVIELLELYGARDCATDVARIALSYADQDDPHIATLHSVIFVHHLALGHFEEAYSSLIANPDQDRREDNLRDMVKTLLEQKKFDLLLNFPYVGMIDVFSNILTARARACDSINNIYYDLLYSFEIKRANLRLAATAMYEQAYRLQQHNTIESIKKQISCYLICINCLNLIENKFKWVIRPVDPEEEIEIITIPAKTGEPPLEPIKIVREIKPISFSDIKKECQIATARLTLAECNPDTISNQFLTPSELIALMSEMGLFKEALKLCESFNVPNDFVFQCLTRAILLLSSSHNKASSDWLLKNDVQEFMCNNNDVVAASWKFLEYLLNKYEEENMSKLHKIICTKLINLEYHIPHWLLASYKKRNSAELIRILYYYGRVLQASQISREYLAAARGHGSEHFGMKNHLQYQKEPLSTPVYLINAIMTYLQQLSDAKPNYRREYVKLKVEFARYIHHAKSVAELHP